MAAPLRAIGAGAGGWGARRWAAVLLAALVALPAAWSAIDAVRAGLEAQAWSQLWREPQLPRAWALTLATGVAATVLSVLLTMRILAMGFPGPAWLRLVRLLPPMLATPHAAFAIGFSFLVAPSGWLLRALSPWATGFDAPPGWPTTQDPWGLGLVAVLVAKEVPFLLWTAAGHLQKEDTRVRLARELAVAHSLGYARAQAWRRVAWPQLRPRLAGPLLAVLAYSLTTVDMALVIGPTSPPTLAVLAWQWLQDGDAAANAVGAAAAWLLAFTVAGVAAGGGLWLRFAPAMRLWADGHRGRAARRIPLPRAGSTWLAALYVAVLAALAAGSVAGVWPFPALWPQTFTLGAWAAVADSASTVGATLLLGVLAAAVALAWAVAWLELAPPQWDAQLRWLVYLPLMLPSVLWIIGVHRMALAWQWDASGRGVWLAHTLAALPYVLMALSPAYLGFDARYAQTAASLRASRLRFLLRVKWPLLKAALGGAFAVGFAVSVAQYVPTLFLGAGRFATVTTEAVTMAAGAQRSLSAAYAWLQWLLPAGCFALAAWLGRPRFRGATR
ncbi:MAG: ABC transporter permease [Pseudomonadota bacterium]